MSRDVAREAASPARGASMRLVLLAAAASATLTPGCRDDPLAAQATESLRKVFDAPHPELGGPFGRLKMGMNAAQAAKAAPDLGKGFAVLDEYPVLQFGYYIPEETERVASARVVVPGTRLDLVEVMTEQWGEPVMGEELGKRRAYWFHPGGRLRATVWQGYGRQRQIVFEPYLPIDMLFGEDEDDPTRLGFDHTRRRLLGAKLRAVGRYYGAYRPKKDKADPLDGNYLQLPPTEYALAFTRLHLRVSERAVDEVRFEVDYAAVKTAKEEIRERMLERFGDPVETAGDALRWEGPLDVEAEADDALGRWAITVTLPPA